VLPPETPQTAQRYHAVRIPNPETRWQDPRARNCDAIAIPLKRRIMARTLLVSLTIILSKMTKPATNGEVVSSSLADQAVDTLRPIKVICIGGGLSGILTAIRFPQRIPNLELVIYEKNEDIGGTWFENRSVRARATEPGLGDG
jgi:hypothetical protein